MFRLFFYPIADSYALVAVIALAMGGLLLLTPVRAALTPRRRLVLAAVRAAVIGLVVLAMLRPTLVYTETKKEKATLVVLADQSRSMQVARRPGGQDALGRHARRVEGGRAGAAGAFARFRGQSLRLRREGLPGRVRRRQDRLARKARKAAKPPSARPWPTSCGKRRESGSWA